MNKADLLTRSTWFCAGSLPRLRRFGTVPTLASVAAAIACSAAPAPPATSAASSVEANAPASSANAKGAPAGESSGVTGQSSAPKSAAGATDTAGSTIANVDAKEDAHWVQADDYFVATRAFDRGYLYVRIAKMKEPAPPGSAGAALFFIIRDGSDERSAYFYRTRPAVKSDIVLGNLLICFDSNRKKDIYLAPHSKDNARPGSWWLGRITDLSDLEKGYATLAGHYHCAPDALRAIVK